MKLYSQIDIDSIKINYVKRTNDLEGLVYIQITQKDGSNLRFQSPILMNLTKI